MAGKGGQLIRRGQKKHRQTRAAQDQARKGSERGDYEPPPREECDETPWAYPGDARYTSRVIRRIWQHRGVLTEFAVSLQVLTAEGWTEVERIDCRHGHVHLHDSSGSVVHLYRLDTAKDVERVHDEINRIVEERLRILGLREDK